MSSSVAVHAKPEILLVDLERGVKAALSQVGYTVEYGTFGSPRYVRDQALYPVALDARLPGLPECEILVVDPQAPESSYERPAIPPSLDEPHLWHKVVGDVFDARPVNMIQYRKFTDRILEHGGLIVILSATQVKQKYFRCRQTYSGVQQLDESPTTLSNWSFLSILDRVEVTSDPGTEVVLEKGSSSVRQVLARFLGELWFECELRISEAVPNRSPVIWEPLAKNKYGKVVAGALSYSGGNGRVLILPRPTDQAKFLIDVFQNALPDIAPRLFPDHVGAKWVHWADYELAGIVSLTRNLDEIERRASEERAEVQKKIQEEEEKFGFLHDLLTESGSRLVSSVKKALETLGFADVLDSDEGRLPGERKLEDLQIRDISPMVLVESKGLVGLPSEADATQVGKYLAPRMKEFGRTDVIGLCVVNHQRTLEGLLRETEPFTEVVIETAKSQGFGLLTTWDLFRIARGFLRLGWRAEYVLPLFYQRGRILPVPTHYEEVGTVAEFWGKPGAVGVQISGTAIRVGERLAYELPIDFVEEEVTSLMIEDRLVNEAPTGVLAGIKTGLSKEQARKGVRVYRVRP